MEWVGWCIKNLLCCGIDLKFSNSIGNTYKDISTIKLVWVCDDYRNNSSICEVSPIYKNDIGSTHCSSDPSLNPV